VLAAGKDILSNFFPALGAAKARPSRHLSGAPVSNRLGAVDCSKPVANRRSNPLEKSSRRAPIL
jgi:hypothetical protein